VIRKSNQLALLDEVYAVGRPINQKFWVSTGIISSLYKETIGYEAGVWFGYSGGPLVNKDFEQIGVTLSMGVAGIPVTFMGFALPMTTIYEDLGSEKTLKYFGFSIDK
jgi:S1-C subfamily serine protease